MNTERKKVLVAYDVCKLIKKVEQMMKKGRKPRGDLLQGEGRFSQLMIRSVL